MIRSSSARQVGFSGIVSLLVGAIACGGSSASRDGACGATQGTLCFGNVLATCVDGQITETDCGDTGSECAFINGAQGSACVPDACDAIGPLGTCDGPELTRCENGTARRTTCDDTCAYVDDTVGYDCVATSGQVSVNGTITYEDLPPNGTGGFDPKHRLPARGVMVALVDDATDQAIATAMSSNGGAYALLADASATDVHVTAITQSDVTARPIRVVNAGGAVYGFGSVTFTADADAQVDVAISNTGGAAEAFNVFDQAITSMTSINNDLGDMAPSPIRLIWYLGSQDGTYWDGSSVHLLGAAADDDGYDDSVIQHEIGHYIETTQGRSSSPGGAHSGAPADPRLAWSEGFATYWGQATLGHSVYADSNQGGGFFNDIDADVTRASLSGDLFQQVSENMVAEILWDVADSQRGSGDDDDSLTSGSFQSTSQVQPDYLRAMTLRNVGASGVDLVDFLDGWFVLNGLSSCEGIRDIVTDTRQFPYDYAGPAGSCP